MTTRVITELAPHPTAAQLLAKRAAIAPRRPDLRQRIENEDRLAGRVMNLPGKHDTVEQNRTTRTESPRSRRDVERRWTEHDHQVRLFAWRDSAVREIPELQTLIAIPNGGHRSKAVAGKLKAEGVRAGVHDMLWPLPRGRHHGLWIELKADGGRPTEAQLEWRALMRDNGYRAEIVEGWEAARDLILRYLTA